MIEYSFQEGVPEGFTREYEPGIFHNSRHFQLQSPHGWHTFVMVNRQQRKILGEVNFHIHEQEASSPFRSPYGSFLFSSSVQHNQVIEFVRFTEEKLRLKGVKIITLKNSPDIYFTQNEFLTQALANLGYKIEKEETSSVISVTPQPFETILHRTKKSRLAKAFENGYSCKEHTSEQLTFIYNFLKSCRGEKNYRLSMSLDELTAVVDSFPERFFFHAILDGNKMIATSISIHVEVGVLYTFYYDHLSEYDSVSPVVFLCSELYVLCQKHKFSLLDLGTSSVDGRQVESLLNFKLSLGAKPSRKLTFVKALE